MFSWENGSKSLKLGLTFESVKIKPACGVKISIILSLGRVESLHALIVSVCLSQPEGFHLKFFHTKIRGTSFFCDM